MPQKKTTSVYRKNLVNVGIGQGILETYPYLYSYTEHDRNGQTLSQSSFTADGLLAEKITRAYDDKGKVIREDYYSGEDELSESNSYERDAKGLVTKEIKKYLDGSTDVTSFTYGENDHLVEKVTLDEEGVLFQTEKFTWEDDRLVKHEVFDEEDNLIELDENAYDGEGHVTMHRRKDEETGENYKLTSKFNSAGLKITDHLYDEEGELVETTRYSYDKDHKLIHSAVESEEKKSTTTYFYDDRGNNLGQEEVNDQGDQILWVENSYDASNNIENSVIFANGRGLSMSQHYELRYEYEWFGEA